MPLKYIDEFGIKKEFELATIDNTQSNKIIFQISLPEDDLVVDFIFPFTVNNLLDDNPAKVFVFKNKIFESSSIFQFRIEKEHALRYDGRPSTDGLIGYIFSLNALLDETVMEQAPCFFETYAYAGLEHILNSNLEKLSLAPLPLTQNYNENEPFRDLYDSTYVNNNLGSDIVFLVINENYLRDGFHFQIERYLCDLYKYGFYFAHQHELFENQWDVNTCPLISQNYENIKANNFIISASQSSELIDFTDNELYFYTCLRKHIFIKYDVLTHFLVLYQVIEVLKGEVLKYKVQAVLNRFNDYTGHQLRGKINELKDSELVRILFTENFSNIDQTLSNSFKAKILLLLSISTSYNSDEEPHNLASSIYKLRNTLLHDYSSFPQNIHTEAIIRETNQYFEYCIIELMKTYKIPTTEGLNSG